ncbi:MAG: hypothetical protein AAF799_34360 [Myxococcota bacterium]
MASPLALAVALALPFGTGCNKNGKLTEVEVPEAGVSLRYDLTPGQEYGGSIQMRTTIQTPMGDIATNLKFNTQLVVAAKEEDGGKLVRATIKDIEMTVRTPDGIPAGATGMDPNAATALNGMEMRFNLSPQGKVSNTPEPPEGAPQTVASAIGLITTALTAGLAVSLPDENVDSGESWDASRDDDDDEGTEVLSSSSKGTLEGMARNEAGEDVAKLSFLSDIKSKRKVGEQEIAANQNVETTANFSASGGYPISLERKINNEIVGQTTILIEIESEWSKGGKQDVAPAPAQSEPEVQAIDDPCDPDYVGMGECVEEGAEPAADPAPAPEAAEATPES